MELQAGDLKVAFFKLCDRFSHRVLVKHDENWSVVLESIEGSDQESWPASPPFQQIVGEPIGKDGRMVLLGVGLSGTGHWSVSVDENDSGAIVFDVACRVSGDFGFLGSTWKLGKDWHLADAAEDRLLLRSPNGQKSLELVNLNGKLFYEQAALLIGSKPTGRDTYPKPHRWAVRLQKLT
jgi:hypothetical protein